VPPPICKDVHQAAFYDTRALRQTLEHLVDFDRLNAGTTRFSAGAVNVRTGNFVYFGSGGYPAGA
jgi:NTE family protein